MRSIDTNIFLYALNADCPEYGAARAVVDELARATDVVVCDLVLVELYLLVRNPAVVTTPLDAADAADACIRLRRNPRWRIAECGEVMERVWTLARGRSFARRRIIDARLAFTVQQHGVSEWITRNVDDFRDLGFERLRNPFAP